MPLTARSGVMGAARMARVARVARVVREGRTYALASAGSSTGRWSLAILHANSMSVSAPRRERRTCALDLGSVRVGVAIDDELGLLAHPRGTLNVRDTGALLGALKGFADEHAIARFVVGLPLDMGGGEGMAARRARAMAQRIADATGRPVELWDERLTTVQAKRSLAASEVRGKKARARVDEAAACAILQSWLDSRRMR
jgi:putative Holliday junction resolvase